MQSRLRIGFFSVLLVTVLAVAMDPCDAWTQSAQPAAITEPVEWTWAQRPETLDPNLPNILLLGDSITRAYYPEVAKGLAGRANCYLFATSAASGDPRLAGQLKDYFDMATVRFSVIHFNNGMHGWGYSESQYAAGLPELLADLRKDAPGAKLIWASTTPVQTDSTTGGATNRRIEARNAAAARLMETNNVPIDHQHALMLLHSDLHNGSVHYTAAGSGVQADQVVKVIVAILDQPSAGNR